MAEWEKPADLALLQKYMKSLIPFYNKGLEQKGLAEAAAATGKALVAAGYTSAEIRFAFRQLWNDETVMWVFMKNYPMNPAMFIPHINKLRQLQSALMFPAPLRVIRELCTNFPNELHIGDFGYCGDSPFHEKLFIFRGAAMLKAKARTSARLQSHPETGPIRLGDTLAIFTTGKQP